MELSKLINRRKIKTYNGQPIRWAHEKKDGHQVEIYTTDKGPVIYRKKRNDNLWPKLSKVKHLADLIRDLPFNTAMQAEMYIPGTPASSVITYLNEASPQLEISPFAIHWWAGDHSSFKHMPLPTAMEMLKAKGWAIPHLINISGDDTPVTVSEKKQKALLHLARGWKYEGWVLKENHLPHETGATAKGWSKLKHSKPVDDIVKIKERAHSN